MKTAIIVLSIVIGYAVIGYVFAICCKAWDSDLFDDYEEVGAIWIFILPFLLLYAIVKFIGKRVAVIPVMIIALIKAKKSEEQA